MVKKSKQQLSDQASPPNSPPSRSYFQVEEVDNLQLDADAFPPTEGVESNMSPMDNQPTASLSQETTMNKDHLAMLHQSNNPSETRSAPHDFQFSREPQKKFPLWIIALVGGLLIIGFIVFKLVSSISSQPETVPSAADILIETSTSQTETAPKEEKKELDRADYSLQVLNGSGITGAAGKLVKILEEAGFKDIEADNADKFNYQGIIIKVKDGQDELGELIESDLEVEYQDIDIKDNLDEDSDYDAIIIRGSQSKDETEADTEEVLGESDEVGQPTDKTNGETETTE